MITESALILSERDFSMISEMVHRHCGINLHDGKKELVQARIAKKLRLGGFGSASAYMDHVLADDSGERFADLVDSLSTNLTSFFRESNHFDFLAQGFLPSLIERKHTTRDFRIRAWSAGCSTGEEPYTLAMTLLEAIDGRGSWDVKLLATDISRRVLQVAQRGVYEKARLEKVPQPLRLKHFQPGPGRAEAQASEQLRGMIRFNYLNLQEAWPFSGPFDFIFCRNVMIYFDKPTQERLINRFFDCLDRGGMLFTGHSESLTGIKHSFRYVQPTIYAKP